MSEDKIEKLDKFLAEHRPEAPSAPPTEYQGILRKIRRPARPMRASLFRSPAMASLGSLAALFIAWLMISNPNHPKPVVTEEAFDAETFISATVDTFYEAESVDVASHDSSPFGELE